MTINYNAIGIAAGLGSGASWAVGAILSRQLAQAVPAAALTWAKALLSIVLLLPLVYLLGPKPLAGRDLAVLAASGLLGIALSDTLFFSALKHLGAHDVVFLLALGQVFTIVLAVVFLHERPDRMQWLGMILVIVGVTVVLQSTAPPDGRSSGWLGIVFGLLSALAMAVSLIMAKPPMKSMPAAQVTLIRIIAGAAGMSVVGVAGGRLHGWVAPLRQPKMAGLLLASACVVTFGGFWLSLVAIKYGDVSVNSTLCSTEPLFALILAAWILKERITPLAICGTVVTLAGVAIICANGTPQ